MNSYAIDLDAIKYYVSLIIVSNEVSYNLMVMVLFKWVHVDAVLLIQQGLIDT